MWLLKHNDDEDEAEVVLWPQTKAEAETEAHDVDADVYDDEKMLYCFIWWW